MVQREQNGQRDCLRHGYSFEWFVESKDYYLEKYSMEDLKDTWNKHIIKSITYIKNMEVLKYVYDK